ncbi:MAG: acetylserotonin O-methyltransferase [Myxococcaceae bacterium]|nr:acetylserotonin O-methyltransferase [Myxococcaceae bacterium]MCI0673296.1 acetylserotonin O-methyltransferase [Myxococcaceae bacterium]
MSNPSQQSESPQRQLSRMIVSLWVPQTLHAAAELGVADALSGGALSSGEVAERLGAHADATERLLRALVTLGLLVVRDERFELSELGRCLTTDSPNSVRSWCRLMGGPGVWQAWGRLESCVRTGRTGWSSDRAEAPSGTEHFDVMAGDARAAEVFHQAMVEMTRGVAPGIVAALDLKGVQRVVDVGGGYGALLCAVLEAHGGVVGSVFDLEHAREGALDLFSARGLEDRASYVAGSFFEVAPPAADVYLLKSVLHDWDDARSLRILGRCREVLEAGARLVVVEPTAPVVRDGSPPDWIMTFSDLNMLVNTGGRERTEAEILALLEAARMRVIAVHPTPSMFRVFEAVPA